MRQRAGRVVRVDVAARPVRACVSGHGDALRAGWVHGQSAQIYREGARPD